MTAGATPPVFPRIAGYRIDRELGRGGMGVVYQGEQEILGRTVAIKALISPDGGSAIHTTDRFLNEARILARMEPHENITQVYDVVRDETGSYYIVMEFIQGFSVEDKLREGARPKAPQAVWIVSKAARGLHHAHQHDIIHRDVKPENIMLTNKGVVKVMDFGIARAEGIANMTQVGLSLGTPHYMSPEQIMLDRPIDARSDVYSLSVVLYNLVCGELPFDDTDPYKLCMKQAKQAPAPPRSVNPQIPAFLENIILTGMSKDSEKRYQTCEEMANALDMLLAGSQHDPYQSGVGRAVGYQTGSNPAYETGSNPAYETGSNRAVGSQTPQQGLRQHPYGGQGTPAGYQHQTPQGYQQPPQTPQQGLRQHPYGGQGTPAGYQHQTPQGYQHQQQQQQQQQAPPQSYQQQQSQPSHSQGNYQSSYSQGQNVYSASPAQQAPGLNEGGGGLSGTFQSVYTDEAKGPDGHRAPLKDYSGGGGPSGLGVFLAAIAIIAVVFFLVFQFLESYIGGPPSAYVPKPAATRQAAPAP